MKVIMINRVTREEKVYADGLTPQKAEDICSWWGWKIDDGTSKWWLDTEEEDGDYEDGAD